MWRAMLRPWWRKRLQRYHLSFTAKSSRLYLADSEWKNFEYYIYITMYYSYMCSVLLMKSDRFLRIDRFIALTVIISDNKKTR